MIKSWLISLLIILFFVLAYKINLFTILSSKSMFILASVVLGMALIAAFIILGNPLKGKKDDETDQK